MSAAQPVLAWCRRILGTCAEIEQHTATGTSNTVIRIRAPDGRTYIAKQHADPVKYDREVRVYLR